MVRSERSPCWDGDIFLSTGVLIAGMGETCHMGVDSCSHERGSEAKSGD